MAVASVLNLTEPGSTGIGGDMFCLFYDAKTKTVTGLNGSGRSPKSLSLEIMRNKGIKEHQPPFSSVHSVTVPGAAAGWCESVKKFGSGTVTMQDILDPAIKLAYNGYPVSKVSAWQWNQSAARIKEASPNWAEMLHADGSPPTEGSIFRNPTLGKTFETLANEGINGFYTGRIAEAIVKVCQDLGGEMTLEDLKQHETEMITPIKMSYGDLDVHECPPNGQGLVALIAIGIVKQLQKQGKKKEAYFSQSVYILQTNLKKLFQIYHS